MMEKSFQYIAGAAAYAQMRSFRVTRYFHSVENDAPSDPPLWNEYKVRPTSSEINLNENQQNSEPPLLATLGGIKSAISSNAVGSDRVEFGMSSSNVSFNINVTSHPKRPSKSEKNDMQSKGKKGMPMSRDLHHERSTKADLTLNASFSARLRENCTNDDVRTDYTELAAGEEDSSMPTSHILTASFTENSSTVLARKVVNRSNNIVLHDGVMSQSPSPVRVRRRPSWNKDRSARVKNRKTEIMGKSAPEKAPKLQTNALEASDKISKLQRDDRKEAQEEDQKLARMPNAKKKQKSIVSEKESSPHHPDKQAKRVGHIAHIEAEPRRSDMESPIKEKKTSKLYPIASPRQGARGNKRKSAVHYLTQRNEKKCRSSFTRAIRGQGYVITSHKKLKIQKEVFIANSGAKKTKPSGTKAVTSSQDMEETQIWKSVIKKRTEKLDELHKEAIQHAGDILIKPVEFRKQFKHEYEMKLIDQKADLNNLLPKDTIQLILNKCNAINNKCQSKLQTNKDIPHLLNTECSNYQNKPTYSKEFWKASKHRVDFMPPENCPEHLNATKTQFFEYSELVKRIKEKRIRMAEGIGGLEKIVGLQALITDAKETVEKGWTEMDSPTKSHLLQNARGMKADVDELLKSEE